MRSVWYIGDHMITPLAESSELNFSCVVEGKTALKEVDMPELNASKFFGSVLPLESISSHSRFEMLCLQVIEGLCNQFRPGPERTLLIVSTTKGNVEFLNRHADHRRISLHEGAKHVSEGCGYPHFMVVSNACISGVLGLIVAKRFIQSGKYDHAIVVGAEVLSQFIISGFQSLHALSPVACQPFDRERKGINLGEAAGAILLSGLPEKFDMKHRVEVTGVSSSNDANHISGPSRTGEELAMAIDHALNSAQLRPEDIDSVSAHGTATIFNDEMEVKAFNLAGLSSKPVYSLKGNFGHTLGAAGVVETIIARQSMINDIVPGTLGFNNLGVSQPALVSNEASALKQKRVLKTASGFGGCNAALILEKK